MGFLDKLTDKIGDKLYAKGYFDKTSFPISSSDAGFSRNTSLNSKTWIERYKLSDDVYAVINLITESSASIPIRVYRKSVRGKLDLDEKHYLNELLKNANSNQSFNEFMYLVYEYLLIEGEVFILLEHNSPISKDITSMWAISGQKVKFAESRLIESYTIDQGNNKTLVVPASDMIHIKFPNPENQYRGLSPLSTLQIALDMEMYAKESNSSVFSEGILSDVIISVNAKNIDQMEKTRDMIEEYTRTRKPLLTWSDSLNVQSLNLSPKEMQFVELDARTTEDVAKVYRVPLQLLSQAGENVLNLRIYRKMLFEDCVLPKVKLVIAHLNKKLASQYKEGNQEVLFNFDTKGIEAFEDSEDEKLGRVKQLLEMGADKQTAWKYVFDNEAPDNLFQEEGNSATPIENNDNNGGNE